MINATVFPSKVSGLIQAPASKSAVQRAFALALLRKGDTLIFDAGDSDDENAARNIIRSLGVVLEKAGHVEIAYSSGIKNPKPEISCGESGLSLRMFAPIAALSSEKIKLTGTGSLQNRSIAFFDEVLKNLDVEVKSNNGFLPLQIKGPLNPKPVEIDGSMSSQYLTGLLFAFASAVSEPTEISVRNLKSRPYIELSIEMLNHFGYSVKEVREDCFLIEPGNNAGDCVEYKAEGDWSGAAFLLAAAAVAGGVKITGLRRDSCQADRAILDVLARVGADILWDDKIISCRKKELNAFDFDATDCPDLFPPLAALAANCAGTSVIRGTSRLLGKESNRSVSIMETLKQCGVDAWVDADLMYIKGAEINAATVHSFHDHRIAMMASLLALNADGPVEILESSSINKSYPGFFRDLQKLGVKINADE